MGRKRKPLEINVSDTGCWIPSSHKKRIRGGYVGYWWNKKMGIMHRYIYEKYYGDIPDGMCVCHKCDNPPCINPKHLFLGTRLQNSQDMVNKGRKPRGEKSARAKLTLKEVNEIRKSENFTLVKLANIYHISKSQIHNIKAGKQWKTLIESVRSR